MLLPEAHPRPGLEQGGIRRRNERIVAVAAFLDPALCSRSVQVAQILSGLDCVPGGLDPDVRSPDVVVLPHPEQEADDARAAKGDSAEAPSLLASASTSAAAASAFSYWAGSSGSAAR